MEGHSKKGLNSSDMDPLHHCTLWDAFEVPSSLPPPAPFSKRTYFLGHHDPYPKTSEFDLKVFCSNSVQVFSGFSFFFFFQLREIIVKLHLKIAFLEVDI